MTDKGDWNETGTFALTSSTLSTELRLLQHENSEQKVMLRWRCSASVLQQYVVDTLAWL